MFEGIVAAAREVAASGDVRAVVLTGEGASFCAGLDVGSLMNSPQAFRENYQRDMPIWKALVEEAGAKLD